MEQHSSSWKGINIDSFINVMLQSKNAIIRMLRLKHIFQRTLYNQYTLLSSSNNAQPSAVLDRTHSEWWGLWKSLSWHDHAQDGVCRIYGRRQRRVQRKDGGNWKKTLVHTPADTPSIVFDRETPAAPWCVSEKSMAWCRGVRGVPFPTTPESTSKCVNSFTGSTMSYAPTLKENHPIVSLFNPDSTFLFFFGIFFKFPPPKNTCVAKMQENPIKPLGISLFSFLLSLCLPF